MLRHSSAHILATAVRGLFPGREDRLRPGDRGRLLLRLRGRAAVHARGPRGVRERDAQGRGREVSVRARGGGSRRGAASGSPTIRSSSSGSTSSRDDEIISTYTDGPFIDLCRGPHVPDTSRLKHFKLLAHAPARTGAATRSARCCSASTARRGSRRTTSTRTSIARGGEEARPPQARQASSTCSCSTRSRPAPPFWTERGHDALQRCSSTSCASGSATTSTRSRRRCSTTRGCGRFRALGQVPREHVPRARQRDGRARLLAQADELPVALPAVLSRRSTRTASCRCATSRSTCCTATR